MFPFIDWHLLAQELDDILDEGGTLQDAQTHARFVIDGAARMTDAAFNFDALINGPAEPIGDLIEQVDYAVTKGALEAVLHFALQHEGRRKRRIARLTRRLAATPDDVPAYARIKAKLDRLKAKEEAEQLQAGLVEHAPE